MVERRELGAMVELLGRRAEAESRTQRLEVETRDSPATTPMETSTGFPRVLKKSLKVLHFKILKDQF